MIKNSLLDNFLDYMKSTKGASEGTVKEYYYDIRVFLRFLKLRKNIVKDIPFDEIEIEDIDKDLLETVNKQDMYSFNAFLERERKVSNRGKYRKISAIRTFYDYLSSKIDILKYNPIKDIDLPRLKKTLPVYLNLEESLNLLNSIKESKGNEPYKSRDYAIVTLFLNCGLRLSELSAIDIKDFKEDNTLTVTGKGNKERTIYLNKSCEDALKVYLENRKNSELECLFFSKRNERISNRAIQHMLKKYIVIAGLDPKKITVHKLRHTAATLMYQYGNADIRSLQEILGHTSVLTTQIYTHVNDEQLRSTIENNPLSNINKINKK